MLKMFREFCASSSVPPAFFKKELVYSAIHPLCHNISLRLSLKVEKACLGNRELPQIIIFQTLRMTWWKVLCIKWYSANVINWKRCLVKAICTAPLAVISPPPQIRLRSGFSRMTSSPSFPPTRHVLVCEHTVKFSEGKKLQVEEIHGSPDNLTFA